MNRAAKKALMLETLGVTFDLALEAHDLLRGARGGEIPGVSLDEAHYDLAQVNTVTILNQQGSEIMGKPIGTYITITSDRLKLNNRADHHTLSEIVAENLKTIVHFQSPQNSVLVVGLGNWKATPDSLGPQLVNKTMATRHLTGRVPAEILAGVRPVSTLSPGVLGITGVETAEIILGVVEKIKPDLIIAFDALAAGDVSRIGTTIQIANTGINPGSGLGNHRVGINQETMGVPVIAIGVPTVVNAQVIAHNVLESFMDQLENKPHLDQLIENIPPPLLKMTIDQALQPYSNNLSVTPKEIDDIINNTTTILAESLTLVLHPDMNADFANCFV